MCKVPSPYPATHRSGLMINHQPSTGVQLDQNIKTINIALNMSSHGYPHQQPNYPHEQRAEEANLPDGRVSAAPFGAQDHPGAYSMNPQMTGYLGYESSNMPTPASTHGSPNMSCESPPRMMATFPSSRSSSQQPPTPGYSRPDIEWAGHTGHQMSLPCSQRSSPMAMPASADMMTVDGFETTSPPSHHGLPAPVTEQHYWGAYGVPGADHPEEFLHMLPSQHFYAPNANPHAMPPTLLSNHPPVSTSPMMIPSSSAQVPVMPGPPHQYGAMNMVMGRPQFMGVQPTVAPKRKSLPRKTQTPRARTRRGKKAAPPKEDAEMACKAEPASPDAYLGALTDDTEELIEILGGADGADEQTLFVYSLWKKYYHLKGKGMWDSILDDWRARYGPSEKPKLQMKIQRGVFNHAIWPDAETRALVLAAEEYDNNRYNEILKLMPKYGGMRRYTWKQSHIAKKLVDLGVDEFDPETKGKKSKCRPKSTARRQTQTTTPNLYDPSLLQQPSTSYAPPQEMEFPQPTRMSPEDLEAMFQSFHCNDSEESPEPENLGGSAAGTPGLSPFYTTERRESFAHTDSGMENDEPCSSQMAQQHCQPFLPQEPPAQVPYGQQAPAADQGHH